jgi:hypothetical protein
MPTKKSENENIGYKLKLHKSKQQLSVGQHTQLFSVFDRIKRNAWIMKNFLKFKKGL